MSETQKIRFIRFNQVFNKAFSQSVLKLQSWDKISSCFPEYSSNAEGARNLANSQQQVSQFWTELLKREFNEIVQERQVQKKLDDLDDLIIQAKERLEKKRIQRKTENELQDDSILLDELTSEQLIECNLHGQRLKAITELDQRLTTLNDINGNLVNQIDELANDIESDRAEVQALCDSYLGKSIDKQPDEVLVQGLNDMLLELQEYS